MEKAEKDNTVKQRMQDILLCISWREIANTYFDRPASWLYNKLNGIDDNGGFTEKEKELLRGALFDLSERIRPCGRDHLGRFFVAPLMTEVVRAYGRRPRVFPRGFLDLIS